MGGPGKKNYLYITDEKFVQLDRAAIVAAAAVVLRQTNSYGVEVQYLLLQLLERKARPKCREEE